MYSKENKTIVVNMRKWHEPKIRIIKPIDDIENIEVTLEIDDFIKELKRRLLIGFKDSLKNQLSTVSFIFKKSDAIDKAMEGIISGGMVENISENIISAMVDEGLKYTAR